MSSAKVIKLLSFFIVLIAALGVFAYFVSNSVHDDGQLGNDGILGMVLFILIMFPIAYTGWRIIIAIANMFRAHIDPNLGVAVKNGLALPAALNLVLLPFCFVGIPMVLMDEAQSKGMPIDWYMVLGFVLVMICQVMFIGAVFTREP